MYLKQVKDVLTLYGGLIILKVIMETKYQNLINYIQEQISDGQLGPGEKVPSENQLSEQFHISRQTVRKAIGTLEEDGLVQRIRGSGTYVSFDQQHRRGDYLRGQLHFPQNFTGNAEYFI